MIGYIMLSEHQHNMSKLPSEKNLNSGKHMASAIDVPGIISIICLPISLIKPNIFFNL